METLRLLWVLVLLFSIVFLVQYNELPYGYALSSLLSFAQSQVTSAGSFLAGGSSNDAGNSEIALGRRGKFPDGKNGTYKHDLKAEMTKLSNESSKISNDPEMADYPYEDLPVTSHSSTDETSAGNKTLSPKEDGEQRYDLPVSSYSSANNSFLDSHGPTIAVPALTTHEDVISQFPPPNYHSRVGSPDYKSVNRTNRAKSPNRSSNSKGKHPANMVRTNSEPGFVTRNDVTNCGNNSSRIQSADRKKGIKGPPSVVVPMSVMIDMQRQGFASYRSMKPQWPSQADNELLNAKTLIQSATIVKNIPQIDVDVYRNYSTFTRSYELMEQTLKIYIYMEGDRPIFHEPKLTGIYASEGWFMKQLEGNKHFVTKDASKAHLFYLPFSSKVLKDTLYAKYAHSGRNLVAYLSNYLKIISTTYQFWNRTIGGDHFLVACHDGAPDETKEIMRNCIRALCNADVRGGLQFGKDVSLPEIYIRDALHPLKDRGGKPPSQRHILAFFAGNILHGYLRPILLNYWKDKDPSMKIFGKLRSTKGQMKYSQYMKSSKYCISARGYEAYTPRVMEAIFYECVPVIISDNYVPPFFETLNWESFAVFILERDISKLKMILKSIPKRKYLKMQERVRQVQKHFLWYNTPVKQDVFHMILHSIWYTRVFQMRP